MREGRRYAGIELNCLGGSAGLESGHENRIEPTPAVTIETPNQKLLEKSHVGPSEKYPDRFIF